MTDLYWLRRTIWAGVAVLLLSAGALHSKRALAQTDNRTSLHPSPPGEGPIVAASPIAMNTTLPRKRWAVEGSFGVDMDWFTVGVYDEDGDVIPGEERREHDLDVDWSVLFPRLQVGATDRLQIGILNPGIAYRLGQRGNHEFVPFLKTRIGFGWSQWQGFIFHMQPLVGLSVRNWFHDSLALEWSLLGYSWLRIASRENCDDNSTCSASRYVFETGAMALRLGIVKFGGRRVSFAPGIGLSAGWSRNEAKVYPLTVRLFGYQINGLWGTPLVRFHFNDYFALGFNGGAYFRVDLSSFGWDAGLNLLANW